MSNTTNTELEINETKQPEVPSVPKPKDKSVPALCPHCGKTGAKPVKEEGFVRCLSCAKVFPLNW